VEDDQDDYEEKTPKKKIKKKEVNDSPKKEPLLLTFHGDSKINEERPKGKRGRKKGWKKGDPKVIPETPEPRKTPILQKLAPNPIQETPDQKKRIEILQEFIIPTEKELEKEMNKNIEKELNFKTPKGKRKGTPKKFVGVNSPVSSPIITERETFKVQTCSICKKEKPFSSLKTTMTPCGTRNICQNCIHDENPMIKERNNVLNNIISIHPETFKKIEEIPLQGKQGVDFEITKDDRLINITKFILTIQDLKIKRRII